MLLTGCQGYFPTLHVYLVDGNKGIPSCLYVGILHSCKIDKHLYLSILAVCMCSAKSYDEMFYQKCLGYFPTFTDLVDGNKEIPFCLYVGIQIVGIQVLFIRL